MIRNPGLGAIVGPCGSHADRPWFCLRSKPRQEPIAVSELRNQDFAAFFPLKASGNGIEGLFPGYLFAQPLEDGRWAPMRSTRGVSDLLMSAPSRPSVVPTGAMKTIFDSVDDAGIMWPLPTRSVTEGAAFRVIDGPFADFMASCSRRSGDRIFGLLTILGSKTEVGFARNQVELVQ